MISDELKEQLKKVKRNLGYLKVNLNVIDPNIELENLYCDIEWYNEEEETYEELQEMFSEKNKIFQENIAQTKNYATLEPNFWILDGNQPIYDTDSEQEIAQAFTSNYCSDNNGNYDLDKQKFEITYIGWALFGEIKATGISFVFDSINNNYPTEIQISLYKGNDEDEEELVLQKNYYPNSPEFIVEFTNEDNIDKFHRMTVLFISSNIPNRRVRVEKVMFGYSKTYTNNEIIEADLEERTTKINSELPTKTFSFSVDNSDKHFNFDNPNSVTKYFLENQPVSYYWGYKLDSGIIEWILGGKMKLTGEISNTSQSEVQLECKTSLSLLTKIYNKNRYVMDNDRWRYDNINKSLYDIAVDIFEYNEIPESKYNLWSGLADIYTNSLIPEIASNELLQMIATAGCCTLYTDRNDIINIMPFDKETTEDKYDYDYMTSKPELTLQPILKEIDVNVYTLNTNSEDEVLYKDLNVNVSFLPMNVGLYITFEHELANDIKIELSNPDFEVFYFSSNGTKTTFAIERWNHSTSRTTDIIVSGKLMTEVIMTNKKIYNDVEKGEIIEYDNPLISSLLLEDNSLEDEEYSPIINNYIGDWYRNRYIYSFQNRGDILKDTNDLAKIETEFTSELLSYIVENKIHYNGAWSGESTVIKLETESGD